MARPPSQKQKGPPPGGHELPPIRGRRRGKARLLNWLLIFLILGFVALTFRQRFVDAMPEAMAAKATEIYDLIGFPLEPGFGLDIQVTKTGRATRNGNPVLEIEGVIKNTSEHTRTIPRVRIALVDKKKLALQELFIQPEPVRLPPGKSTTYSVAIDKPAVGASNISVGFVKD